MRKLILFIICVLVGIHGYAGMARFSTVGFYELPNTGREAYSLNQAWRFWKGEADGTPYAVDYDDTDWEVVSVPHGLEYLPVEASGCANYQGVAWYRKHFTPADSLKGKQLFVHFEGIMGKSEVYVNGSLVKKHYGGYLPVIVDVSTLLKFGEENVIAVKADNSDDPTYPVGKEQSMLDFTYFGGIYRDCWLVAHNDVFITNAKKLRDAGLKVIRTHYVIDPVFMDACDELGLFALVEVPGWQFWNKEPIFAERIYSDIRNMIRIHRNHASLFFWEPILNETHYPETFAKRALEICGEEYPYPYSIAACDHGAAGDQYYDLLLRPIESKLRSDKTYFIREWGDNVDDWNAQNSDSRVARGWGEVPMLLQAEHYANPSYQKDFPILCYESICQKPAQIVGACFWHSFDHQRGYHADPFYGGIMDAFRQPKTSYYMFMSQREPVKSDLQADNGPMVYIAHELTPFSPEDITVYSNCDEVRLTVFKDGKTYTYKKDSNHQGMPSPIIKFTDAFHFMEWKAKARARKQDEAYLLAEGLMDGKVVATHKRYPAGQADHIRLRLDDEGLRLEADGSDVVTVIAEVVDKRGTVKRLNNSIIRFTVEGEGRLLGGDVACVNPMPVVWGSAPALIQATGRAGKIKVTAALEVPGEARPLEGTLEFESIPTDCRQIADETEMAEVGKLKQTDDRKTSASELEKENARLRKELNQLKVKEVEKQQTQFGVGIND